MALVAYDNSEESDYEEDEIQTVGTLIKHSEGPSTSADQTPEFLTESSEDGLALFNLLPQPSTKKPTIIEEDDEFLHKREKVNVTKPKAKITVPSLKDFKDVDTAAPVKPKAISVKKSGLLSILPQPRNGFTTTTSKSLMPHVLIQKKDANAKKNNLPTPAKKPKMKLENDYSDDSENENDVQNDFFSIHKPVEVPIADIPFDIHQPIDGEAPVKRERTKLESYFKQDPVENHVELEQKPPESYEEYDDSQEAGSSNGNVDVDEQVTSDGNIEIDQEAILKLCGARGKRNREEIQMVDVNQKDLLADAREWLLKGLMDDSSKRVSASKRRGNEPTSQQKRKHQITYLAHQAKANEAELQNQWANSRMSRRQTQNKYGF